MRERRNDLEIRNEIPQIALQIPNSDRSPLYDVRYHAFVACLTGKPMSPSCNQKRICFLSDETNPTGGARRDRTDDLMLAKHALSQLSYGPLTVRFVRLRLRCGVTAYARDRRAEPKAR